MLWTFRNASGFLILDGTYSRETRREPRLPLADGTYRIRVGSDLYLDAEFALDWPPLQLPPRLPLVLGQPGNVVLLPGPAYPLPDVTTTRFQLGPTIIRGTLFEPNGTPIPDVPVEAINLLPFLTPTELPPITNWPFLQSTSSQTGDWAVVLPGRRYLDPAPELPPGPNPPPFTKPITIRIHYPGGPFTDVTNAVELGTEFSLRNTALRGQVLTGGGLPIKDAVVQTSVSAATSLTRPDGTWFLYFDLNQPDVAAVTVTVTTPGGATASDATAQVRHGATVVVPTFRVS
jgi:hypothetical protein